MRDVCKLILLCRVGVLIKWVAIREGKSGTVRFITNDGGIGIG